MEWVVEYITNESANILVLDENKKKEDYDAVGIGFRPILAEKITKLHNDSLILLQEKLKKEFNNEN